MDMSLFVNDRNIARYRLLASAATKETERRSLFDLLGRQFTIAGNIGKLRLLESGADSIEARATIRGLLAAEETKYVEFELMECNHPLPEHEQLRRAARS